MANPQYCHCENKPVGRAALCWKLSCLLLSCVLSRGPALAASPEKQRTVPSGTGELLLAAHREQDLYLAAYYGDRPTDLIVHARLRGGHLYVTAGELRGIGLAPPSVDANEWIALDTLPGLTYRYDIPSQSLILQAPPQLRRGQHLGYRAPSPVEVHRDHGLLLNYDFYARDWDDSHNASLGTSLNWFGRFGSLRVSGVSRGGEEPVGYRRLDSFWTYSDPERLWTWTAGDLASGGHSWTRPVRMAGVQWRRNFDVRPELITLPIPRFDGSAALPSSVELYVNNRLEFGEDVDPGPFVLDTLPRISGAGTASLVVTDALGRRVETSAPLYVDHRRLAPGLSDFSVELGTLRHDYRGSWDDYGDRPVASASWLYGVTDSFTFEAHGEAASHLGMAGVGGVWSPGGRWGLFSVSGAYSDGREMSEAPDRDGYQYSFGYQWFGPRFGFDLHRLRRSRGYLDLADLDRGRSEMFRWLNAQDRATLWMKLGRGSLGYSYLRYRDHREQLLPREFFSNHSLSFTQNFGRRLSVSAIIFNDSELGSGGSLDFSIPLAPGLYASIGAEQRSGDEVRPRALLRRNAPYDGGWGWWLRGSDSDSDSEYAQAALEVRGRYGEARAGVDRSDGEYGYFAEAGGSVVAMDGGLFASRRIHDAFALVYTGVADMPVLSENRSYGRTDSDGYLLVPELRGWQRNRLGIDPDWLGPEYSVAELEQFAVPPDRAGQLVEFSVRRLHPALVTLLDESGSPVTAGARALLYRNVPGGARQLPVGFGGQVYVEDIGDGARIEVHAGRRLCHYRLEPDARGAALTRVQLAPDNCGKSELREK